MTDTGCSTGVDNTGWFQNMHYMFIWHPHKDSSWAALCSYHAYWLMLVVIPTYTHISNVNLY